MTSPCAARHKYFLLLNSNFISCFRICAFGYNLKRCTKIPTGFKEINMSSQPHNKIWSLKSRSLLFLSQRCCCAVRRLIKVPFSFVFGFSRKEREALLVRYRATQYEGGFRYFFHDLFLCFVSKIVCIPLQNLFTSAYARGICQEMLIFKTFITSS